MRAAWLVLWVAGLAALELAVSPRMALSGVSPDWLLLLAVYAALERPGGADGASHPACVTAWGLGLLSDLLTGTRLGPFALAYLLAALGLSRLRLDLARVRPLVHATAAFAAASAVHLAYAAAAVFLGEVRAAAAVPRALEIALYTAAVAPVLWWMLGRTRRLLARPARASGASAGP